MTQEKHCSSLMNRFMEEIDSEEQQNEIHSLEMKGPKIITYLKLIEPKVKRYTQPWQVSKANLNSTLSTLLFLTISLIFFAAHRQATVSITGINQTGNRKAPLGQKVSVTFLEKERSGLDEK